MSSTGSPSSRLRGVLRWWTDRGVSTRILTAVLAAALVALAVGVVGVVAMARSNAATAELYRNHVQGVEEASTLRRAMVQMRLDVSNQALALGATEKTEDERAIADDEKEATDALATLKGLDLDSRQRGYVADIEKQLARRFRGTLFLNEGVAGRDSAQWKLGLPRVQREIGALRFDAILLSIGGNDVVGEELREFVKTPAQAQSVGTTNWGVIPPEVFDHVRLDIFEYALGYAIRDFREVVQYRDMYSRGTVLFAHTYDYIYPDGAPFRLGHQSSAGDRAGVRLGLE